MSNTLKGLLNEQLVALDSMEGKIDLIAAPVDPALETTSQLIQTETDKIPDMILTLDHIDHEATETAHHFHSYECWFGAAPVVTPEVNQAEPASLLYFEADSGNNDWGTPVCVLGTSDSPFRAGMTKYDIHRILIVGTERTNEPVYVRFAFGNTEAAALAAGDHSCVAIYPSTTIRTAPINFQCKRQDVGTKCWVNVKCGSNTGWVRFFVAFHEYLV